MENANQPGPKKKLSGFRLFLLLLIGLFALTFVLDAMGLDVISKQETEKTIDRPHPGY
ncbi:MAG: hypothetical protein AAGF87_11620 [Bacteroidota bacterium]